jgi:hypothetical protein
LAWNGKEGEMTRQSGGGNDNRKTEEASERQVRSNRPNALSTGSRTPLPLYDESELTDPVEDFAEQSRVHPAVKEAQLLIPRIAAVLAAEGREFTPAPRPKGIRKRADHQCLYNSLNLAFTHDDLTYCEGLALVQNVPGWTRHSWCAAPDGTVVDVTWREPGAAYFGVPFDTRAAARAVCAQGRTWSWILEQNSSGE